MHFDFFRKLEDPPWCFSILLALHYVPSNAAGTAKVSPKHLKNNRHILVFSFLSRTKRDCEPSISRCKIESWIKPTNSASSRLAAVCHPATETCGFEFFTVKLEGQFYFFIFGCHCHGSNRNTTYTRFWRLWENQTRKGGRWLVIKEESWCLHIVMCTLSNQLWWGKRQKRPVTV